jgi:hypothetical protein
VADINCFEWQSRSSDFLDGALMGPAKQAADRHLEGCPECSKRHQHYRLILTSIASQPRTALPPSLRKSPLSASLPRAELDRSARTRWQRIPWLLRTSIEGTLIVLLILTGISAGPKLRSFYEKRIERSLNEFSDSFAVRDISYGGGTASDTDAASAPLARGKLPATDEEPAGDDFEDDSEEVASEDTGSDNLTVGSSEIWRFNLKTDSPHEIRPQIVQILKDARVPANSPGLGGIEAPGGIQFDLLVPKGAILDLKRQLQKMAPKPSASEPVSDKFTWYKNKSKRRIPEGRARVVIWLSQI